MEFPRGRREGCNCPVCRNVRASQAEEELEGLELEGEEEGESEDYTPTPTGWQIAGEERQTVFVDLGWGNRVEVPVGAPFAQTIDQLAEEAHYGGQYRVFLNGTELVDNPFDANGNIREDYQPQTIEAGMRIAITAYDKPGS